MINSPQSIITVYYVFQPNVIVVRWIRELVVDRSATPPWSTVVNDSKMFKYIFCTSNLLKTLTMLIIN